MGKLAVATQLTGNMSLSQTLIAQTQAQAVQNTHAMMLETQTERGTTKETRTLQLNLPQRTPTSERRECRTKQ